MHCFGIGHRCSFVPSRLHRKQEDIAAFQGCPGVDALRQRSVDEAPTFVFNGG